MVHPFRKAERVVEMVAKAVATMAVAAMEPDGNSLGADSLDQSKFDRLHMPFGARCGTESSIGQTNCTSATLRTASSPNFQTPRHTPRRCSSCNRREHLHFDRFPLAVVVVAVQCAESNEMSRHGWPHFRALCSSMDRHTAPVVLLKTPR